MIPEPALIPVTWFAVTITLAALLVATAATLYCVGVDGWLGHGDIDLAPL